MNERVSQKDLAARLNLSQAAVSMALRNDPRIRTEIRKKVQMLANELGYRPDPILGALARYRAANSPLSYIATVAYVLPCVEDVETNYLGSPFALEALQGAEAGLEAMGYRCERFVLGAYSSKRLDTILRARGIRGVIFGPTGVAMKPPPRGVEIGRSVIQIGRIWPEFGSLRVTPNHFDNMLLVCKELNARGYKRIGFAYRHGHETLSAGRWIAAYRYCVASNNQLNSKPIPECWDPEKIAEWMHEYTPDAVIASDVWLRLRLLEKTGLRAPQDIGFVSMSVPGSDTVTSGILQRPNEIGRIAARQLDLALNDPASDQSSNPATVLIPGVWQTGTTVK